MTLACVGFVGSSRSICAFHDNHDTYIIHSTHTYVFIVFSPVYLLSIFADQINGKYTHKRQSVFSTWFKSQLCQRIARSMHWKELLLFVFFYTKSQIHTHIGTLYCVLLNNVQFSMMNFRFHLRLFDVHTELSTWMKWINSFFSKRFVFGLWLNNI